MIDFSFISELEGRSLTGYVPDPKNSNSGVTIADGFDLGQRTVSEIKSLPSYLVKKLNPYLGIKKQDAVFILNRMPLEISEDECVLINEFTHKEATYRLLRSWPRSSIPFDCLADECQTVIASVSFQYGSLEKAAPNFWRQVTTGDWVGALSNLRNFGDSYKTRRNKEADLLETRVTV